MYVCYLFDKENGGNIEQIKYSWGKIDLCNTRDHSTWEYEILKKRKDKNERPSSISGLEYAYVFYDLYDYLNCEMEYEYFNGMVQVNRRHWKNNYDYITINFAYRNTFIHYKKNWFFDNEFEEYPSYTYDTIYHNKKNID